MNSQLITISMSTRKNFNFLNKYYDKKNDYFFYFV